MLGVTESTLRQWTDEGKIGAFVTPGGHRRYSESEVREFMGTQRRVHGVRDLAARIELTPAIELELAHTRFAGMAWYAKLDRDSRARLGAFGREVHRLVLTCISRPNRQDQSLELARNVGREFGAYLAEIDISLVDSVEAFLLHRAPLIEAATDLMKKRESLDERAVEAVPRVARVTDEILLALVAAYQERQSGPSGTHNGAIG
jgi:excisionase family DNA binding protein